MVSQFKILVSLLGKERGYICVSCVNLTVVYNELVSSNQIQQGTWVIKAASAMTLSSVLQESLFRDHLAKIYKVHGDANVDSAVGSEEWEGLALFPQEERSRQKFPDWQGTT